MQTSAENKIFLHFIIKHETMIINTGFYMNVWCIDFNTNNHNRVMTNLIIG